MPHGRGAIDCMKETMFPEDSIFILARASMRAESCWGFPAGGRNTDLSPGHAAHAAHAVHAVHASHASHEAFVASPTGWPSP